MTEEIIVSIIIPVYNEEKYISKCMESIVNQTYFKEHMEVLLIDGGSQDSTLQQIEKYSSCLNLKILYNDKRIVTHALNIGIKNATGDCIIRMDAHAEFERDYVEKCVNCLENNDAWNVGGIAQTVGLGKIGEANASILSSKFGVGNSSFRIGAESGYVDTVPFGAFKKEVFDKVGLFDPDLPRSEDNDMNSRIRQHGGKVYLDTDIRFKYYCRNTVSGLLKQGIQNGNALFLTIRKNPKAMSVRHFIPFTFVMSLLLLPVISIFSTLFVYLYALELLIYFSLDLFFSIKSRTVKEFAYKMIMYPMFHIVYGIGSIIGMIGVKLY